ncbi:FliH/SctL family protein [Microbacteriaceae bacterium 4G12]
MFLSNNRIPKNSVSFSNESYQLKYILEQEHVEEESQEELDAFLQDREQLLREKQELLIAQEQLQKETTALQMREEQLKQEQEQLLVMKQAFEEQMNVRQQQFEEEKQELYYQMSELLWEHSLQLAEKVVNQAIDTRQLSMLPILKGVVETLPIAFEKLYITVNPETFEQIQKEKEETKEYWLLELVEWKFDFSLQFGEFIIEEDKEFFEFKFEEIFKKLTEKWQDQKQLEEIGQ